MTRWRGEYDPPVHPPEPEGEECENCGNPVGSRHCTCEWEDEAYELSEDK